MSSHRHLLPIAALPLLLLGSNFVCSAQPASPGRLDFLKAADSSFALLAIAGHARGQSPQVG